VSVLVGNGNGTFQAPRNFAVGSDPRSVAVGDFNGDARPDFAVSNVASGSVSVLLSSGNANFSASTLPVATTTGTLAAADFTGDGVTDLAVPTALFSSPGVFSGVKVFNGLAGGTLQAGATYALSLSLPTDGDFNGDGHLDLAGVVSTGVVGTAVEPWLNNGN